MTAHEPDSGVEQRLRAALTEQADSTTFTPDALEQIRSRTRRRPSWAVPAAGLAAAAALVGVVTLGALGLADGPAQDVLTPTSPTPSSTAGPTATPAPPAPSVVPSASPGASTSAAATALPTPTAEPSPTSTTLDAVPVYWLAETDRGPRLYREFLTVPDAGGVVTSAVAAMLRGEARDPDYGSLWAPGTRVLSTSVAAGVVTVDLSAQARTTGGGSEAAALTVQQLIWTATAAAQVPQARLTIEGEPVGDFWGAVTVGTGPQSRGPSTEVLAPVWLERPADGERVGTTVTFGGTATVFEATVSWQVLAGGAVVAEGFDTASEGAPGRGTWAATVTLPPGEYVLKAFESSAEDGRETAVDTKRITVG